MDPQPEWFTSAAGWITPEQAAALAIPVVPPPAEPEPEEPAGTPPRWALVTGGKVFTVVQQETEPELPGYVAIPVLDGDAVGPGHTYAEGEGFTAPAPAAALRHITRLAFLQRFLDSEAVAIDLASQGPTPQAAAMRRYMQLVNAATYIDLDRPDTRAGVIALESAGLLQQGRAVEILDTPLSAAEAVAGARP